jgi:hypothetical protein
LLSSQLIKRLSRLVLVTTGNKLRQFSNKEIDNLKNGPMSEYWRNEMELGHTNQFNQAAFPAFSVAPFFTSLKRSSSKSAKSLTSSINAGKTRNWLRHDAQNLTTRVRSGLRFTIAESGLGVCEYVFSTIITTSSVDIVETVNTVGAVPLVFAPFLRELELPAARV